MIVERFIAICVFHNNGRILAAPGYDDIADEKFFRPLGGQIEPKESPEETVVRELREETGLAVSDVVHLGVLDNQFVYRGEPHREVVHVLDGRFVDSSVYKRSAITFDEPVWEGPAQWIDLRMLPAVPIYPDGLIELLEKTGCPH